MAKQLSDLEINKMVEEAINKALIQENIEDMEASSVSAPQMFDAKNQVTLPNKLRKIVNTKYQAMGNYFKRIPLDDIFNVLEEVGITPLMEDHTPWSGFLTGHSGRALMDLGYEGKVVKNSVLTITWYKMESGKYECIFYI